MISRRELLATGAAATVAARAALPAFADDMPGITAKEIRIGQTMPYSGPASAYGIIGRTEVAFFKMINAQGGINGRQVNLISLDDGYSPPKAVEDIRRLVEQEKVAFIFQSLGTPSNSAIMKYLNQAKIPQLFVATGAAIFSNPKLDPWTMGFNPNYQSEAAIYAKHILANTPNAKIGVLYQNDDFGQDYLTGLKSVLTGDKAKMITKTVSYEVSEPTVDSQIVTLQGAGVDVMLFAATPKFGAQAVHKSHAVGFKGARYISNVSAAFPIMKAAGLDAAKGLFTAGYVKDTSDPALAKDPGYMEWAAFCAKYMDKNAVVDGNAAYGYAAAQTMLQVLKQCGNDLSRANILKQAQSLKDFTCATLLPGIKLNTSATNYSPIRALQIQSFDGAHWKSVGGLIAS